MTEGKLITDRERAVIQARYVDRLPWKEVGARIVVSPERARQIAAKAARKLRHPNYKADPARSIRDWLGPNCMRLDPTPAS